MLYPPGALGVWFGDAWTEREPTMITLLGWVGAGLALVAYAQTGAARFRQIALLSSVALLTFNVILGIWSNVALECALGAVNVGRLVQLRPRAPTSAVLDEVGATAECCRGVATPIPRACR